MQWQNGKICCENLSKMEVKLIQIHCPITKENKIKSLDKILQKKEKKKSAVQNGIENWADSTIKTESNSPQTFNRKFHKSKQCLAFFWSIRKSVSPEIPSWSCLLKTNSWRNGRQKFPIHRLFTKNNDRFNESLSRKGDTNKRKKKIKTNKKRECESKRK